jgi:hypothetical protein
MVGGVEAHEASSLSRTQPALTSYAGINREHTALSSFIHAAAAAAAAAAACSGSVRVSGWSGC